LGLLNNVNYRDYLGQCDGRTFSSRQGDWDGCDILTCDNNRLDIDYDVYTWNGIRVDVPKEEFKSTSGNNSPIIETHGEMSPVTTGPNSPVTTGNGSSVTQQNMTFTIAFGVGTVFGIILKVLYDALRRKHSKRSPGKDPTDKSQLSEKIKPALPPSQEEVKKNSWWQFWR